MPTAGHFYEAVYQVVKLIPRGKVCSYGAIATYLGSKGSARMVGWAMNAAPKDGSVPAHRVVNSSGLLTGRAHFSPPEQMQELLESEGVPVKDHQVQNFSHYFWDPAQELL